MTFSKCTLDCYKICVESECHLCRNGVCQLPPRKSFDECETAACDIRYGYCYTVPLANDERATSCVAYSGIGKYCVNDSHCSNNSICGPNSVCEYNSTKHSNFKSEEISTMEPRVSNIATGLPLRIWWIIVTTVPAVAATGRLLVLLVRHCQAKNHSQEDAFIRTLNSEGEYTYMRGQPYWLQEPFHEPLPLYVEREEPPPKYCNG
ncbi:uncharacterized protein VTP21DRAFT_2077 [Calcarisporiella thermophila]|uniref:uncharacterized protein n=1 Tax=Calcarisporiella thermophila TaxID=911321 RepID=UPI003743D5B7